MVQRRTQGKGEEKEKGGRHGNAALSPGTVGRVPPVGWVGLSWRPPSNGRGGGAQREKEVRCRDFVLHTPGRRLSRRGNKGFEG